MLPLGAVTLLFDTVIAGTCWIVVGVTPVGEDDSETVLLYTMQLLPVVSDLSELVRKESAVALVLVRKGLVVVEANITSVAKVVRKDLVSVDKITLVVIIVLVDVDVAGESIKTANETKNCK